MKLAAADPRWLVDRSGSAPDGSGRHGMGVTFRCPVHGDGHRIAVWFANPLDGGPPLPPGPADNTEGRRWQREGNAWETLTLTPSIHVLDVAEDGTRTTHWHGWVRAGEIVG